ncbi:MAG: hypothetical protein LBU73_07385 [Helicobacteraceae bacterium]|jgi:hypothetical protein|nr:hypothetical protein [Helicobacteraceae bacterium]
MDFFNHWIFKMLRSKSASANGELLDEQPMSLGKYGSLIRNALIDKNESNLSKRPAARV